MNLSIDVGNTEITFGLYKNNSLVLKFGLSTTLNKKDILKSLYSNLSKEDIEQIQTITLSSVVPYLKKEFKKIAKNNFGVNIKIVNAFTKGLGLKYLIKDPSFIGSDLIVNSYAAKSIFKTTCIICDFGTATTIQLVGGDGTFYGAAIAPGLQVSMDALVLKAAKIDNFTLNIPKSVIGIETNEALNSGIVGGSGIMIDGFIKKIKTDYKNIDKNFISILTGGFSSLIKMKTKEIDYVQPNLTLDGLNMLATK